MIFCTPAVAATCRGLLFPQSQSSPSGFSSPPRSTCSRVSESPIAEASCKKSRIVMTLLKIIKI